jgi:hypothetical protein
MRITAGSLVVALAAAALAVPAGAAAQAETEGIPAQLNVGARISAALPMGSVLSDPTTGSLNIDDMVTLSIPLQLEVGVTLAGQWSIGAYLQYGWSFLQIGHCKVGETCQLTGLRVGIQALFLLHDQGDTPWIGLGTGWEWMFTRYSSANFVATADVAGWEFANLQVGYDVEVSPGWRVGPWISGSIGEFSQATVGDGGPTSSGSIPNKALHGWLQLGVKGSFGL